MEFKSSEDVGEWLKDKPIQFAQVLALRAALRVYPLAVYSDTTQLTLMLSRCLYISCIHCINQSTLQQYINTASNALYVVAHSGANSYSGDSASFSAYSAVYAAETLTGYNGKTAIENAVSSFNNAFRGVILINSYFKAIGIDAQILTDRYSFSPRVLEDFLTKSLWPEHIEIPEQIKSSWEKGKQFLLKNDPTWGVWIEWYEQRLLGNRTPFISYDVDWNEGPLTIALKDNKFWQQDAPTINQAFIDALTPKPDIEPKEIEQNKTVESFDFDEKERIKRADLEKSDLLIVNSDAQATYEQIKKHTRRSLESNEQALTKDLIEDLTDLSRLFNTPLEALSPHLFYLYFVPIRSVFERHQTLIAQKEAGIFDPEAADHIENLVMAGNLFISIQPNLQFKEERAKNPYISVILPSNYDELKTFIREMAANPDITTEEVKEDIEIATEATEEFIKEAQSDQLSGKALEPVEVQKNFLKKLIEKYWKYSKNKPKIPKNEKNDKKEGKNTGDVVKEEIAKETVKAVFKFLGENKEKIIDFLKLKDIKVDVAGKVQEIITWLSNLNSGS